MLNSKNNNIKNSFMDLNNKNVCFVAAFNCPYGGNFIPMLRSLAYRLRDNFYVQVSFVFPKQDNQRDWLEDLKKDFPVYITYQPYSKTMNELQNIFSQVQPHIVHSHFACYDKPIAKVLKGKKDVHMVWHIHGALDFYVRGLRWPILRLLNRFRYSFIEYALYGKNAFFIAVSPDVAKGVTALRDKKFFRLVKHYKNEQLNQMTFSRCVPIINGVDMKRIGFDHIDRKKIPVYTFLTFGGREVQKNVKCLIKASLLLRERGITDFKLLITKGIQTKEMLCSCLGTIPDWIELVEQTEDVKSLFIRSSCYVSTAIHETMSMAIAEATFYGIPVIQSDIPGTYWNSKNPSVMLFRSRDAKDLSVKMEQMMNVDSIELQKKCEITKSKNEELLSLDTWVSKIIDCYHSL